MDVLSTCPLQVGALYWMPRDGAHAMTVVVKGTFELRAGRAQLARIQDFPNDEDNHWNDDPQCSIYSANDMAPFKRRPDVMLVGEAFAPRGEPARSVVVRMIVGAIEKSIEVYCERYFDQQDELVYGERFLKMQLRYERAAGGPHTTNPVGMNREGERDRYGRLMLPNLQPVGVAIATRNDFVEPVGFGPIAASWDTRRKLLGRHAATWSNHGWYKRALPHDIDGSYFNAAPLDQRLNELHDNERIVLENMHPDEPQLVSHLPGIKPIAYVERGGAVRGLDLRADTLWIDTTRSVATVTWRGRVDLDNPREAGRVLIGMQKHGEELTWGDIRSAAASVGEGSIADDMTDDGGDASLDPELPFTKNPMLDESTAVGIIPAHIQAVPAFIGEPGASGGVRKRAAGGMTGAIPQVPVVQHGPHDRSPSWLHHAKPDKSSRSSAPPPPPPKPPPPAPPAAAQPEPSLDGTMGYGALSPWARAQAEAHPSAPPPPMSAAPAMPPPPAAPMSAPPPAAAPHAAAPHPAATHQSGNPAVRAPNPVANQMREQQRLDRMEPRADDGRAPHDRAAVRSTAQEIVELLWFDDTSLDDIRGNKDWADIIEELRNEDEANRLEPVDFDEEPPEDVPLEVRDRRDIVAVMTRGRITTSASLNHSMLDAVDGSGSFEPPVVMMSGRLHFPFDELETLKATLAAVTPLIAGNKDLKDTVDTVEELMKTPWLQEGSGDVAEGLTEKVREAFKRGDRLIDANYLDDHTERILLEQRRYQKREVLGAEYIRAMLAPSASRTRVPCYIPAKLAKELPMFKSFPSRVIAEAHVQQDQFESCEQSLKVVALGRVVQFTKGPMMH